MRSRTDIQLRSYGVTEHITSLSELAMDEPRKKIHAFCGSMQCSRRGRFIKKEVRRNAFMCPDCGDALVWMEEPKRKRQATGAGVEQWH